MSPPGYESGHQERQNEGRAIVLLMQGFRADIQLNKHVATSLVGP